MGREGGREERVGKGEREGGKRMGEWGREIMRKVGERERERGGEGREKEREREERERQRRVERKAVAIL